MSDHTDDSEEYSDDAQREEPIFGRTMVNGKEFDAVLDVKKPNGRATFGLSRAESLAIAQLMRAGVDETELPDDVEDRMESMIRTFERTKTLQEVADEVATEERARGAI